MDDTTSRRVRARILAETLHAYAPGAGQNDDQVECPDCGSVWPDGGRACGECGLTIETVAQRLADRAASP